MNCLITSQIFRLFYQVDKNPLSTIFYVQYKAADIDKSGILLWPFVWYYHGSLPFTVLFTDLPSLDPWSCAIWYQGACSKSFLECKLWGGAHMVALVCPELPRRAWLDVKNLETQKTLGLIGLIYYFCFFFFFFFCSIYKSSASSTITSYKDRQKKWEPG